MADVVRVADSGAGVYYAPQYLALELGFFAGEGLQVERQVPGGARLVEYLSAGRADVALGGIWRPLMYRGRLEPLRAFAMLCTRNPQIAVRFGRWACDGHKALNYEFSDRLRGGTNDEPI